MKKFSEETRKRMSESAKKRCTPEWRKKKSEAYSTPVDKDEIVRLYNSGLTQEEVGKILGVSQKVIWKAMKRFGIKARIAAKRNQWGEQNSGWKGEDAGYQAMHLRVERRRGKPQKCEECGTAEAPSYEWANMTGNYDDPMDYKRMCLSCHRKHDDAILNITGGVVQDAR